MKNFGEKFRQIFIPFLIISASCIVLYSVLRWMLFIESNTMAVDEDILNFWAPCAFPWIAILIWLRPRIKLLNLKNKNGKGDPLFGYMMVASIAIAAPTIVAQAYLETATGKLTKLDRISQLDSLSQTKFYTVTHFYADKQLARFKPRFEISGRYNSDFDMYIYGVVPVYASNHTSKTYNYSIGAKGSPINSGNALIVLNGLVISPNSLKRLNPRTIKNVSVLKGAGAVSIYGEKGKNGVILIETGDANVPDTLQVIHDDNVSFTPYAWLCIKYQKTISNRLSGDEKDEKYRKFAQESEDDFKAKALDKFSYLDRVPYGSDLKGYQSAINADKYSSIPTPKNILLPVYEPFEARNGYKLPWIFGAMGIGSTLFLVLLLIKPLREDALSTPSEVLEKNKFSIGASLKQTVTAYRVLSATYTLIALNILVFIAMVFSGLGFISFEGHDLMKWGANFRPSIDKGEYWRLLTNTFLHGGLMHILMNMYALFFAGIFLEPVLGRVKYFSVYIICGITASIASAWWHPATVSVGASGAIFGLFGVLFALSTVNMFSAGMRKGMLINVSIFIGYNLLAGLSGGIDNAAHIGGLLTGLVLGYILYPFVKDNAHKKAPGDKTQQIIDELTAKSSN